jgi:alpha/beta superfamily hydrolase
MTLSPEIATCNVIGFRFGNVITQPVVSVVATSVYVVSTLSLVSPMTLKCHLPAVDARLIGANGVDD